MIKEKIRADAEKKLTLLGYSDNTKEEINDIWHLVASCGALDKMNINLDMIKLQKPGE